MIIAIICVAAAIVGLSIYQWRKAQKADAAAEPAKPARSFWEWSTEESRIDDWVNEAEQDWPYIQKMPLFWVACLFSLGMIALDINFGWSYGGNTLTLVSMVYILLFVGADLALPIVALQGTRDTGKWYEMAGGRSTANWLLIFLFTFISMVVVIGSTSETSTVTNVKNDISIGNIKQARADLEAWNAERNAIPVDRGYDALIALAKTESELAKREQGRGGCGPKCDQHTKAAADYEARAEQAKRKEELTGKIEAARKELSSMDNVRSEGNTLAKFGSEALGIEPQVTRDWAFTFLGCLFAIGTSVLWIIVDFKANVLRKKELEKRYSVADAKRETAGLPKKYTVSGTPQIEDMTKAGTAGDTIIVNAETIKINFANDAELLKVNDLFGTLVKPVEGGSMPIPDLYRLFRLEELRKNPTASYMTETTLRQKLATIAQWRDDVTLTADAKVLGWAPADVAQKMEAAE